MAGQWGPSGGDAPSLFAILFLLRATAMFAHPWLGQLLRRWFPRRASRRPPLPRRMRLHVEGLEERTVPTVFNVGAGDVAGLIADINTANTNGQSSNTINLTASIYDLTAVNNFWYGPD